MEQKTQIIIAITATVVGSIASAGLGYWLGGRKLKESIVTKATAPKAAPKAPKPVQEPNAEDQNVPPKQKDDAELNPSQSGGPQAPHHNK